MNNLANMGSGPDHRQTASATNRANNACGEADGALKAGLFYVACDLRELAKTAPPVKADELLALCRLVEAMATA
jgi:hypothetical protein